MRKAIFAALAAFAVTATAALLGAQTIRTVAGGAPVAGQTNTATQFSIGSPQSVTGDASGNLYVADPGFDEIYKITPAGVLSLYGGGINTNGYSGDGGPAVQAAFYPSGLSMGTDAADNLYFADGINCVVRKITASTGIITTVAGTGTCGYGGDGGTATSAELSNIEGVAVDAAGDVYIADQGNNRVREVAAATGLITTVAGSGSSAALGPGVTSGAALSLPMAPAGVGLDGSGNLYVLDGRGYVWEVNGQSGNATLIAGQNLVYPVTVCASGTGALGDGCPATQALMTGALSIAVDASGDIYFTDMTSTGDSLREITASGTMELVAGSETAEAGTANTGSNLNIGDGGPALSALFASEFGVFAAADGSLYVADPPQERVRRISGGQITTVAGNGFSTYSGDGGLALAARLQLPYGLALDAQGDLLSADNNSLRKISPPNSAGTQTIQTLTGTGTPSAFTTEGGPALGAGTRTIYGVAADAAGDIIYVDSGNEAIREISAATGDTTTLVGQAGIGYSGDGGPASAAEINAPRFLALDAAGNIYFGDNLNHRIREITVANGEIQTVVGNGTVGYSGDGGPATAAEIDLPSGIAFDAAGDMFFADTSNHAVREVAAGTGIISTVAGNGTAGFTGVGGLATAAEISYPLGVALDASGDIFFSDQQNVVVYEVVHSTGDLIVLSGAGTEYGNHFAGAAADAGDFFPSGLAVDAQGDVFVGDEENDVIREIATEPAAALSTASVSFGAQALGTSAAAQTVTLTNSGGVALNLTSIAAAGANAADFSTSNNCGSSLAAGAECAIQIGFTPSVSGAEAATLTITDNASGSPQTVSLSGTGIAPVVIGLSETSLAFASQAVGTTSGTQDVVVSNTGGFAASIGSVAASGDFTASSGCGATLAAGAQCVIEVAFAPTALGARTGTLTISDNAGNSPQQVALSGTGAGAGVALAPASLNFGGQQVGTTSNPLNFTVSNTSATTLTVTSATATTGFAVTGACANIAAGASCSFGVTFTPTAAGAVSGTLTLTDSAGTQSAPLAGLGTASGVTVGPSSLNFGSVLVGSASYAQQVTMTNDSSSALTSLAIAAQAGDFTVVNTGASACGASLAAGASCGFEVTLTPSVAGADTATLAISDSLGTQSVALAGVGIAPGTTLSAAQVSFGSQTVGTSSGAQTVALTNSGTAALAITAVSSSSPSFTENDDCVGTLAAGASCSINISFAPQAAGTVAASLSIADGISAGQSVALAGDGVIGLSLSPAEAQFGSQELGGVSPQQTVNVTNTGTTTVYLTNFVVSGDFQVGQNLCLNALEPGETCQVFVTYTPSAIGASQGSLALSDATGANAATIALAGTGSLPGISASPATLAFGGATVGVAAAQQTVTVSNNGTAALNLQGLEAQGDFAVSGTTCLTADGGAQALAAGASCIVSVTMTPTSLGTRTGALVIYNDADGSLSLALTGTGQGAGVSVSPTQLAFGSQPVPGAGNVNLAPAPQTVTVTNNGSSTLVLSSLAVSGGFSQNNNCGGSIAAGASCTINVSFNPAAQGQWTGTLTINDNSATGSPQLVTLNGFGSPNGLTLTPAVETFGGLAVGTTSAPATATLNNATGQAVDNLSIQASGQFAQTNTCPATLANGASCAITMTVTPRLGGVFTGSVFINGALGGTDSGSIAEPDSRAAAIARALANPAIESSALNLAQIAATSNGNPAGLSVSAASLTFASQAVGAASAAQIVTVTNSSSTAVSGLTVTSTPDFPITSACTASLAAGANCTVSVEFEAVAAGNRTGNLVVAGTGGLQSTVALSGTATGGTLTVTPSTLSFAALAEGTASAAQTVTLSNTGSASIALSSITSSNADFAVGASTCGTMPATLAASASCTVGVVFTPSTTAAETATLTVASNASNGNAVVGMSGAGSTAGLTLTPGSLSFGGQGVGVASAAQVITLANPGAAAIGITSIAASGDFSEVNNCGATLAAGANCAVQVTFTPSAAGARTGSLVVTDAAATQAAALSGTGTQFVLAVGSTATQTITAGGTAVYQVSLNPGTYTGAVTLACSGAPASATCTVSPASMNLTAGGAATTATVTVTTTARSLVPVAPTAPSNDGPGSLPWTLLAVAGLGLLAMGLLRSGRRRLLIGLTAAALLGAACGGNTNLPDAGAGTPAGVYTLTVTATAGSVSQTATLTLGVN